MNAEKISEALDVLAWFSDRMVNLPEHRDEAVALSLHCSIVQLALGDLGLRLVRGEDPYEALVAAAAGETEIDPAKADLLRTLRPLRQKD